MLLVGKAAGYASLLRSLRRGDEGWLALGPAGEALAFLGYILAFRGVARLEGGPRLGFGRAARIVFASLGATRLVGAGGLAVLYWALRREGAARRGAIARVAALNVLLYAVFALAAWLAALLLVFEAGGRAPRGLTIPWLVGVAALFGAALGTAAWARTGSAVEGGRARRLAGEALAGIDLVRGLLARPRTGRSPLAGAPLFWGGDVLCLWASLRAFDVSASLPALFLAYATVYVVTVLPLPAGGVGAAEASLAFALAAVGLPLAPALLGVIFYRLFSFWLPTVPGLALLASLPWLRRRPGAMDGSPGGP